MSTSGSGLSFVLNSNPNIYSLAVDEIRRSTIIVTPDPLVFRNGYGVMEPTVVPAFVQSAIQYDADDFVISSTHYKTGLNTFEDGSIFIQNGPFNRRVETADPEFLREFIVAALVTYPDDPTDPDFIGDINILSRQKISIYSAQNTFIDAANLTLTCPGGNFKLYGDTLLLSAAFLLDMYSNAFYFHTPLISLGGIDSQISGSIAWNAALSFEAFGAKDSKLYSQGKVFVTSGQKVDIFVQDQIGIPLYPIVPCLNGDITLRCNGQFFIPLSGIPPVNVGSINLYGSNTGGVGLYAKAGGITIQSELYLLLNAGITINAQNSGPLNLTGGPVSIACNTSVNIQSPRFKVNLPTRDSSGAGVNGAMLTVEAGDWTNTYTGGTCPLWSAANLGTIRILSTGGAVTYTTACTLFVDEPTDGDGNTTITNLYALFVNGKSLFSNLMDIQNKVIFYLHS